MKKVLSLVLSLIMIFGIMAIAPSAFADDVVTLKFIALGDEGPNESRAVEAINEKLGTVNCKDVISKYNMADPDQRKAKLAECKGIIEMCAAQSIREICKEI